VACDHLTWAGNPNPIPLLDNPNLATGGCAAGDVAYDHVTYEYEPGSVVLKDVSFTVPGGQTIAFVVGGRGCTNLRCPRNCRAVVCQGCELRGIQGQTIMLW